MPHAALLNHDIVDEIFSHLRVHTETNGISVGRGWRTLASAARVCTIFREPATRALWWSIPGIEPVLYSLVAASWMSVLGPDMQMAMDETKDIPEDIWRYLRRCTLYTRVILRGCLRIRISPNVYVVLSHKSLKDPLFPHLRTLTWHSSTPDHLGLLPLLSPTLQGLTLDLGPPERRSLDWVSTMMQDPSSASGASTDQLLQTVLPRMKGLKRLEVRGSIAIPCLRDGISWTCFAQLENLRTLTLDHCCVLRDIAHLRELSLLPSLTELSINILLHTPASAAYFDGFPALRKLQLHMLGPPIVAFLDVFNSPGLHTFWISCLRLTPKTMPAILSHIAKKHPDIRSITIKELSVRDREISEVPGVPFDAAFGKIIHCLAVEEFIFHTIRGSVLVACTDADLALLAQSWPSLRLFSFLSDPASGSPLTHRSVATFARHCPQLRVLHLRGLNFRELAKEELEGLPPSDHSLEELGICAMRGALDTLRCARYLCRLFPQMRVPVETRWACPVCSMTMRFGECANVFVAVFTANNLLRARKEGRRRPVSTAADRTFVRAGPVGVPGDTTAGAQDHND
ncbi:hypothetical protein C8Q77DRAFT_1065494 [Trametes polyzona]|nr:hypothetical protein C8Q77DRAFT_1065494 [Trametes polyzona]